MYRWDYTSRGFAAAAGAIALCGLTLYRIDLARSHPAWSNPRPIDPLPDLCPPLGKSKRGVTDPPRCSPLRGPGLRGAVRLLGARREGEEIVYRCELELVADVTSRDVTVFVGTRRSARLSRWDGRRGNGEARVQRSVRQLGAGRSLITPFELRAPAGGAADELGVTARWQSVLGAEGEATKLSLPTAEAVLRRARAGEVGFGLR
jgi:hypothetical protein